MNRPSWAAYFMNLAREVSKRSTCDRKAVGCLIVVERRIVSTGFNGSLPGLPHCDEAGHDLVGQHCLRCGVLREHMPTAPCPLGTSGAHEFVGGNCARTVHAEANAVAQAARHGVSLLGAHAHVNTFPCWPCFRLLVSAGVCQVWFDDEYRVDERVALAAKALGIALVKSSELTRVEP